MGIVTKTGDRGKTSLYCGKRVPKDDLRIETCGAIDEASSFLGLAKNIANDAKTKRIADYIQRELVILGSEVATTGDDIEKLKKRIDKNSVCILEKEIDDLENVRKIKMKSFCIPGENMTSSHLDIARAVTRRAERRCVTMVRKGMVKNKNIAVYLNRLSDLLYLLARSQEKRSAK